MIEVDLTRPARPPALVEPDDFGRFHVVARGDDPAELGRALERSGLGRLAADHAFIDIEALRRLADRSDAAWSDGLAAMVSYARSKGWVDETTAAIRAHVEWVAPGDPLRQTDDTTT